MLFVRRFQSHSLRGCTKKLNNCCRSLSQDCVRYVDSVWGGFPKGEMVGRSLCLLQLLDCFDVVNGMCGML